MAAARDKPAAAAVLPASQAAAPRPLGLQDILAWKSIGSAELSPDGMWLMYKLSPLEGERNGPPAGRRDKEYRFPIGEAPRYGSAVRTGFSADSKWAAFLSYPGSGDESPAEGQKKVATTAVLVNLATGEKTEFEKIRGLAFSGDNPGFVALSATLPTRRRRRRKTSGPAAISSCASSHRGKEVNIGNVAEYAFDKADARLALLIDAQGRAGNGLQLRDMASGAVSSLDNDKASYKSLAWTEKGSLTVLKGKEDKAYEDKLWSVLSVDGFRDPKGPRKIVYDPAADKSFPQGMTVSPDRRPGMDRDLRRRSLRHPRGQRRRTPKRKRATRPSPDRTRRRRRGPRGSRRRGYPRSRHLARRGQAPPVPAAGRGEPRPEVQLRGRIPD